MQIIPKSDGTLTIRMNKTTKEQLSKARTTLAEIKRFDMSAEHAYNHLEDLLSRVDDSHEFVALERSNDQQEGNR